MEQTPVINSAPVVCHSEYDIASLTERIDAFLGELLQLVFWVDKDGAIHLISGLSKDLSPVVQEESCLRLHSISRQSPRKLSLDAVFFWLQTDFEAFVETNTDKTNNVKQVLVEGKKENYDIRFSKVITADANEIGVIVTVMAQSEIGRSEKERCQLDILKETMLQIRTCVHDFSQPLMVISGYVELMELSLPDGARGQFDSVQHQIEKINRIFKTLRGTVLSCKQKMDLMEKKLSFNPLNVSRDSCSMPSGL